MNYDVKFNTYPEGWDYAKKLLDFIPEEGREAYLTGYVKTIIMF